MKPLNSYKVTFVDVSPEHIRMFLPIQTILMGDVVSGLVVGSHFEVERLTDEQRYWKCEYIVKERVVSPAFPDWATPNIRIDCFRGKDTVILLRPPIQIGKQVEYGWCDAEIEMEIQNKFFTKGLSREDAMIEVFNEA